MSTNPLQPIPMSSPDAMKARAGRVVFEYDLPLELVEVSSGIASVGIAELTADEELQASRRTRGDSLRLTFELARESLVTVALANGARQRVSLVDGTADTAWNKLHPKARQLVAQAYVEVNNPTQDQAASFRESRRAVTI